MITCGAGCARPMRNAPSDSGRASSPVPLRSSSVCTGAPHLFPKDGKRETKASDRAAQLVVVTGLCGRGAPPGHPLGSLHTQD